MNLSKHLQNPSVVAAGAGQLTLRDNYRSTPEVLLGAEAVLQNSGVVSWLRPVCASGASVEVRITAECPHSLTYIRCLPL